MARFHAHIRRVAELQGIAFWYAENTLPGQDWKRERDSQLHTAHITLFLTSPDFIDSDEHIDQEVLPAIEREKRGETRILPILLKPVHWQYSPLGNFLPLPENGIPAVDKSWQTQDHAFFQIVDSLQLVIDQERTRRFPDQESSYPPPASSSASAVPERQASARLEQIIHNFRGLRRQIANFATLREMKGFSLENCQSQYNRLYGDSLVYLAAHLPECLTSTSDGFIEMVHQKTAERLRRRGDIFVATTRFLIPHLAQLEKLTDQIDACIATLESYKQRYFRPAPRQ